MFESIKNLFANNLIKYCDILSVDFNKHSLKFNEKVSYLNLVEYDVSELNCELLDIDKKSKNIIFTNSSNLLKTYDKFLFENSEIETGLININCGFLGREYNKTCSLSNEKLGESKKMLFEIITGEGYILIQSLNNVIGEIKIVKVKKNDLVLIEKDCTFTIINSSSTQNLILFYLKEKDSNFNLNVLKNYNGNILYYTKKGFIKNENIGANYDLHEFNGDYILDMKFDKKFGLYKEFVNLPQKFNFLKE